MKGETDDVELGAEEDEDGDEDRDGDDAGDVTMRPEHVGTQKDAQQNMGEGPEAQIMDQAVLEEEDELGDPGEDDDDAERGAEEGEDATGKAARVDPC